MITQQTVDIRYHLRIFQQLPHQILDKELNENKHFPLADYESGNEDRKAILTFKVNFLCQKSSESFQFFFH